MSFTKELIEAVIAKLRILEDRITSLEQKETAGAPRGTATYIPRYKASGIGLEDSVANASSTAVGLTGDANLAFLGTAGGGGQGITYPDSGGTSRYALLFPGSNVIALANRAANGRVDIRANDSTAGSGGERTFAIYLGNTSDDLSGVWTFGRISQQPLSTNSGGNCGVLRQQFMKQMAGDNTTTAVFRVLTNDATNDAGHYHCVVDVLAMNNAGGTSPVGSSGETATAHERFEWVRAMENGGTGVNSALQTEHGALLGAATAAGTRDIISVNASLIETSEFDIRFRTQIDGGGTSPTPLYVFLDVKLMWAGFEVEPQILAV